MTIVPLFVDYQRPSKYVVKYISFFVLIYPSDAWNKLLGSCFCSFRNKQDTNEPGFGSLFMQVYHVARSRFPGGILWWISGKMGAPIRLLLIWSAVVIHSLRSIFGRCDFLFLFFFYSFYCNPSIFGREVWNLQRPPSCCSCPNPAQIHQLHFKQAVFRSKEKSRTPITNLRSPFSWLEMVLHSHKVYPPQGTLRNSPLSPETWGATMIVSQK